MKESVNKIIEALSDDVKELRDQTRYVQQKHLENLLNELSEQGNLVKELIYAIETHLRK